MPERPAAALLLASILSAPACVGTEERELAPAVASSPEAPALGAAESIAALYSGVEIRANESDTLENLETLPGGRIARVDPFSPAARAGLQAGDVVLRVDGKPVNDQDAFDAALRAAGSGKTVHVEARRDTVVFAASLTSQASSGVEPPRELHRSDPIRSRADYRTVSAVFDGQPAVAARIERLLPKSPLAGAGLAPGDLIVRLDGEPLSSAQDLIRRLLEERGPGARVRLTALRDSETHEVSLRLWRPERVLTEFTFLPLYRYHRNLKRDAVRFALVDLWLFSLFSYEREAGEKSCRILYFIRFGSGEGELKE